MTLYSTNCPKCRVLKSKLNDANIKYELVEDLDVISSIADERNIHEAPFIITDDNELLNFKESLKYLNSRE